MVQGKKESFLWQNNIIRNFLSIFLQTFYLIIEQYFTKLT